MGSLTLLTAPDHSDAGAYSTFRARVRQAPWLDDRSFTVILLYNYLQFWPGLSPSLCSWWTITKKLVLFVRLNSLCQNTFWLSHKVIIHWNSLICFEDRVTKRTNFSADANYRQFQIKSYSFPWDFPHNHICHEAFKTCFYIFRTTSTIIFYRMNKNVNKTFKGSFHF